jgi:hypothetical protein
MFFLTSNIFLLAPSPSVRVPEQRSAMPLDCFVVPFHIPLWAFYATVFRLLRLFYNYKVTMERDKANKMDDVFSRSR